MQDEQAVYTQLDMYKNINMVFSQAEISQGYFPKRKLPKWRLRMPNLTYGKLPLGKLHIWEVTLGKSPNWENAYHHCIFTVADIIHENCVITITLI